MKKIIAISLTIAMLFALAVPAFAAWGWISDVNNTSNFITSEDKELPVSAGRLPDGEKVALGGAEASDAWQYAYPYTLNKKLTPGRYSNAADIDVYIMYDANALYIREVRRNTLKPHVDGDMAANSADQDSAVYTVLLPNIVMGTTKDDKTPVGAQVKVFPTYLENATRGVPSVIEANKISYAYLTDADGNKIQGNTGDLKGSSQMLGAESYTRALTEEGGTVTSYEIETKILWNQMGVSGFTPEENTVVGFMHYINVEGTPNYKTIHSTDPYNSHNEWDNFMAMTLRGVNADASSYKIDMSWYNGTDTEFTLTTAGQLMGLSYLVGTQKSVDEAKAVTAGKTFKLGADIDLNPAWTTDSKTPPLYYWMPIGIFAGTLDGQGHEISNMICNPVWNIQAMTGNGAQYSNWQRDMGFIAHAMGNVTVKDLAITDSEVKSNFSAAGLIAKVIDTAATVNVENVYVDANVYMDLRKSAITYNAWHNTDSYGGILIGRSQSTAANWAKINNAALVGSIDVLLTTKGSAVGTGPVWGTTASSSASISNVLVMLTSNTATAYDATDTEILTTTVSHAYRTRLIANGDGSSSTPWTESNTVYIDATTNEFKTGASQNNATNKTLSAYPDAWVEAGQIKMPASVAEVMKHNLWMQRSKAAEGETVFNVRVLSLFDAYQTDGTTALKIEMSTDGGATYAEQTAESDTVRYTSVTSGGSVKTAAELGGKYIVAATVANVPASGTVKLRVTPMNDIGSTAVPHVPASVVTYIDGVMQ